MRVCVCVCACAHMYDTDQCPTHLNSLVFFCSWGRGEGCLSFHMVLWVGCLGGTVPALRVYRISYLG